MNAAKRAAAAIGAVFLLGSCAASVAEVAAEPVFEPPPDATEVYRSEREGGGGGFPTTRVTVIYAVPNPQVEVYPWYQDHLSSSYDLLPERSDGTMRHFLSGRNPDSDSEVDVRFHPIDSEWMEEVPAQAVQTAPSGTILYVEVEAEKD